MKRILVFAMLMAVVGAASAHAATISNPWSGVAGDRGNWAAFVFKATAGTFPASVTPAGAIDVGDTFTLNSLTFTRPDAGGNAAVGAAPGLSSLAADVYLDVYATRTGTTGVNFTGFLGSSTNSHAQQDIGGTDLIPPGTSFTYNFSGLTLNKNTEYWIAFSETSGDGDIRNFRTRLNTSGTDGVAGAGKGYLVGNAIQLVTSSSANQDWAVEYVADVTPIPIPEPSSAVLTLAALGLGAAARKRGRRS